MLDRHPEVVVALDPFMPLFRSLRNAVVESFAPAPVRKRFHPNAPFQDYYFDPDGPALLDTLLQARADIPLVEEELVRLRRGCAERTALEAPALGERMDRLEGRSYAALIESGLRIVAGTRPHARWTGCKEVWIHDFVPLLARALPQARFYSIERDPRAIVASLAAMAERDPSQAAHAPSYMRHWRKSIALARRYQADPELRSRFRSISYEHAVAEPEKEARRICEELDIPFSADMLKLSADGWGGNSSYPEAGRDVYSTSSGRWRTTLAEDALRAVDFLCGPEMGLTDYRAATDAGFEPRILRYLERASGQAGSWRSDSGDPMLDIGSELLRHALVGMSGEVHPRVIRRCFLFAETFDAIVHARNGATIARMK